ncbi:hypothetical protein BaRGS_00028615, partial [Batillaria attramentaria]
GKINLGRAHGPAGNSHHPGWGRESNAVSVSVSCFTLVVISIERFYAICQPLRSRRWQTLKHSYRVLVLIWLASFLLMLPIAVFTKLHQLKNGVYACREIWDQYLLESMYAVVLDVMLFAMPLLVMGVSYALVARELWSTTQFAAASSPTSGTYPLSSPFSLRTQTDSRPVSCEAIKPPPSVNESGDQFRSRLDSRENDGNSTPAFHSPMIPRRHQDSKNQGHHQGSTHSNANSIHGNGSTPHLGGAASAMQALRPEYYNRVLANKRRVIKMLCFVVVEYFVCWAPLYTLSTWTVIDYMSAHRHVTQSQKAAILLLAYLSSCVHPITYCFMNKRFRQSFADAFRCCAKKSTRFRLHSEGSQGMKLMMSAALKSGKSRQNGVAR